MRRIRHLYEGQSPHVTETTRQAHSRSQIMDPATAVSLAASIITILQVTGTMIAYINNANDAPKEIAQCALDASNLMALLARLNYRVQEARIDESTSKTDPKTSPALDSKQRSLWGPEVDLLINTKICFRR